MTAAALVNGFVVAEFVGRYQGRPEGEFQTARYVLAFAHAVNQVCSRAAVLALSAAAAAWSAVLVRRPGPPRRVGALGCVAGGLPAVALVAGRLPMNVHGMLALVVAQTVWGWPSRPC
jgi:hypothetical protein